MDQAADNMADEAKEPEHDSHESEQNENQRRERENGVVRKRRPQLRGFVFQEFLPSLLK